MNVHISYKMAKAPDVEREFSHHISKLQKRLQVYRPELVHLHGIVDQSSSTRGSMMVSLNLRLPTGQMAAQEEAPTAVAAAKRAFTELVKQLTKHKEQLRSASYRLGRKRNGIAEVPFEQTLAAVHAPMASGADISSYINANAAQLIKFIERELRYRVNTERLRENQLTPEEVLDEAVATALDEGEDKPETVSIGRWMYRLSLRAIDKVANEQHEGASGHLEDSVRKPNVRASDEPQLQYHQPDEALLLEHTLADHNAFTPEEIASSDEFVFQLEKSLLKAPREDREAFVLYAIEGFTLQEISTICGRDSALVNQSLQAALHHLQKSMRVPASYKERVQRASQIA